jgi:hypothetical protein
MRKCHHCHGDIGDAAIVCPHCRRETIPGRRPDEDPAPTVQRAMPSQTAAWDETATRDVLASVNTRLTILIGLGALVLLAQGWQIVAGVTAHRQLWEYAIESPSDTILAVRLRDLGATG